MPGEVQLAVEAPPIACPVAHQVGTPHSRHQKARRADAVLAQLPAGARETRLTSCGEQASSRDHNSAAEDRGQDEPRGEQGLAVGARRDLWGGQGLTVGVSRDLRGE